MAGPPVFVGAVHVRKIEPFPGKPITLVGADGTVAGTTAGYDEMEEVEPFAFFAVTTKV
jgi:hypothetical protein